MALPGQPSGINNTAFIFGTVALAFVLWITAKGDLPKWLGMLGLGSGAGATGSSASAASKSGNDAALSLPSLPTLPALGSGSPFGQVQTAGLAPAMGTIG
jgi:hypothetical protein